LRKNFDEFLNENLKSVYKQYLICDMAATHNPKVPGSNPGPATKKQRGIAGIRFPFFFARIAWSSLIMPLIS